MTDNILIVKNLTKVDVYEDVSVVEVTAGSIQGPKGDKGDSGATITVGTTTTGDAGTSASVTNSGTISDVILNFTIPKGAKGDTGLKGDQGDPGTNGANGIDGDSAYDVAVANGFVGTEQQWLDSLVGADGEPGPKGDPGDDGATGTQGAPGEPGVAVQATPPIETDILWLDTTVPGIMGEGPGVAAGGTTGQYLIKVDGTDYNTQWSTLDLSSYSTITGSETLTNKTLSSPTITGTAIVNTLNTSGTSISGSLFSNITSGTAVIGTALTSGGVSIAPGTSFNGTVSIATGGISSGTRTVNIGTGQATGATTNINLGSSNGTSVVSINSELATRKSIKTGTNSFGKNVNNGDIALDNGTTDTPGILFYDDNNTNFGIDVSGGLRFVRNLNEAGGTVIGSFDTSGNFNIGASVGVGSNLNVTGTINGATLNNTGWVSFTPDLSTESGTWTLGNGSIEAAYKLIGKTCHFRAKIVIGSTTSIGAGTLNIGLPVTAANANYQFPVSLLDAGQAWYQATANGMYLNNTSKFAMICVSNGTVSSSQGVTNSFPFSFLDQDYISVSGSYEVA